MEGRKTNEILQKNFPEAKDTHFQNKKSPLNVQNTKEKPSHIKDIMYNFKMIGTGKISCKLSQVRKRTNKSHT